METDPPPRTSLHFISQLSEVHKKRRKKKRGRIWRKSIVMRPTFPQPWPLNSYIHVKCSYKVLFLGLNLWLHFKLGEICGEQGRLACGCACNTQSPDARLASSSSIYQSGHALCSLKSV